MIKQQETSTEHYKRVIKVLGKKYVQGKIENQFDYIHISNKGLSPNIITNFRLHFNIPLDHAAHMLNVSEPTIYRWTNSNKQLERNVSVKLFEITDLFLYGIDVFGSQENFFVWLELPNTALGGMKPRELVEIPDGTSKIRDILGRIEHGIFS